MKLILCLIFILEESSHLVTPCTIHLCFPVETMHLRKTHKSVAYNESKEKKKFGVLTIDNNGSTIWSNEFRMLMPSNRSKYMTKVLFFSKLIHI